jgi:hypothetical protein
MLGPGLRPVEGLCLCRTLFLTVSGRWRVSTSPTLGPYAFPLSRGGGRPVPAPSLSPSFGFPLFLDVPWPGLTCVHCFLISAIEIVLEAGFVHLVLTLQFPGHRVRAQLGAQLVGVGLPRHWERSLPRSLGRLCDTFVSSFITVFWCG